MHRAVWTETVVAPFPPAVAKLRQIAGFDAFEALEAMGDAVVYFDADDRLVGCNDRYQELYGTTPEGIVPGARFGELLRAAVAQGQIDVEKRSPEDYVAWRLALRRLPTSRFDLRLRDGRCLRVSERRTSNGGRVGVHTDVSELKDRENALKAIGDALARQNVLFDAALNNMLQGLCMFDDHQRLIVVNRRYLDMYGFSPQVVKPGITLREIMEYSVALGNYTHDDGVRALAERPSQAAKREQVVTLQRLRDGRVIAVMHSPLPNGGSVATYEDVTQRERSEATLRDYAARLEDSNRELQSFAFVASHDLQEPLRKIEAFSDRLKAKYGETLGDDGAMYLERMHNAAGRMRRLITDLLRYSRVTTQAQPFERVELQRVVGDVISDLQIAIEERGGTIDVAPLPIIEADATQIRQLFQNLLSNSLKFRKQDVAPRIAISGSIFVRDADAEAPADYCRLVIADNGIGFDNKYAERIFTIFQRLHGKTEYDGTGIGLATVRKIVDRHRGSITAEGAPGEGSTFTIILPTQQASQEKNR